MTKAKQGREDMSRNPTLRFLFPPPPHLRDLLGTEPFGSNFRLFLRERSRAFVGTPIALLLNWHKIQVNNSLVYIKFVMSCNHHHYLILDYFHHPMVKLSTCYLSFPFSYPPAPGKHQSAFCLCGFSLFVIGPIGEGSAVATKKLFGFRGLGLRLELFQI